MSAHQASAGAPRSEAASLRVLVADEDEEALDALGDVLRGLGHEVAPYAVRLEEAIETIAEHDPDLAIVMVHRDAEHALALIAGAVELTSGPVIAQVPDGDVGVVARAADEGIDAYVTSLRPDVVQASIELALRRHRSTAALEAKVGQLEGALERRAVIERAKGIVMERHGLEERAAFEALRGLARSRSRRLVDVAQGVVDGLELVHER